MANEYLTRTPTSTGNRKIWTISCWVKLSSPSVNNRIYSTLSGANDSAFRYNSGNLIEYFDVSNSIFYRPISRMRDVGSWTHLMISYNSTISTSTTSRIKIFVNGVEQGNYDTQSIPSINLDSQFNVAGVLYSVAHSTENFKGEMVDMFLVDGQALTPDVFGFYKQGKGYISAGSTQATDFRPGQWVPKSPRTIKTEINRRGGFGVNGFYLPMNDSNNFGADFHCDPNSIITLNEKLPQPRVGVATTASVGLGYTDVLRSDPYAANLVLALPFVSSGLCTNGTNSGINTGFGDYSAVIKGSGTSKSATLFNNVSIATTASYYGSAVGFTSTSSQYISFPTSNDFSFGTGDFTLEHWLYLRSYNNLVTIDQWINSTTGQGNYQTYFFNSDNGKMRFYYDGNSYFTTGSAVPLNQWSHVAVCRKGTTISLYIDGVCSGIQTNVTNVIGRNDNTLWVGAQHSVGPILYFDGYIQDLRIYKGVAKYTGGFDVPRPYRPVGIATWRQVPDTTANNFATWNSVSPASDTTYTNGNLTVAYGSSATRGVVTGTIGIAVTGAGKYYWETRIDASSVSPTNAMIGLWGMGTSTSAANYPGFTTTYSCAYYGFTGNFYYSAGVGQTFSSYGASYTTGDIIGITLDMTTNNGTLSFYKNGVSQGVATTGLGTFITNGNVHALMPAIGDGSTPNTYTTSSNFGQNPTFSGNTTAGTFTDANGRGLFKYQPPSGFLSLCSANLPTPAISDPGKHFKTVLYTGDFTSGRSIVGVGFTPDLVWIKSRDDGTLNHVITDSVRGADKNLFSDLTNAEGSSTNRLLSLNSDGFSLGATNGANKSNGTFVAWCWRAGAGTTSTNTNGSITSVVSVNQDAGFSIVSYTGNGSSTATVGHGLGKTPAFLISKARSATNDWWTVHKSVNGNLQLETTSALITSGGTNGAMGFPSTLTNTTFTFTNGSSSVSNVNNSGTTYITYCWAEIEGFSKFGSYVGNGNADGPFVYCGFKPAVVILKNASNTTNWRINDSARNSSNPNSSNLYPNLSNAEDVADVFDFLSNGFKIRRLNANENTLGETYVFAAFAESPFTTANSK